jgi:hemolysin III
MTTPFDVRITGGPLMSLPGPAEEVRRQIGATAAAALRKPLLRGYLHAVTAPVALVGAVVLLWLSSGNRVKQVSFLIYGFTLVLLLTVSAVYHVGHWKARAREFLRRFDHSNIYLLIAGTYTPVAVTALNGWLQLTVLIAVWILALAGIVVVVGGWLQPHWVEAMLYVGLGWIAVIVMPKLAGVMGWNALAMLVAGGLLYTIGAVFYGLRWPRLSQRVFGYHELFHVFVVAASVLFYLFMLRFVLPFRGV